MNEGTFGGCGADSTLPVGSKPLGDSPYGVHDMAGGVWDWTADWYAVYDVAEDDNPTGPPTGMLKVMRGGGWDTTDIDWFRSSARIGQRETNVNRNVGFRCARIRPRWRSSRAIRRALASLDLARRRACYPGFMKAATAKATYETLLGLPEDVRAEVVGGQVVVAPSPLPEHGRAQRAIGRFIGGPFDDDHHHGGHGGWWILPAVDVRLGAHDIVRPDVSGWRRARLPSPWGHRPLEVAPDWVCEIISPSNAAHDHVTKRRLYAGHGSPHYWLVDPMAHTLEALRLDGGVWIELGVWGDGDIAHIEPFAAVELDVGRLFPPDGGVGNHSPSGG